MRPLDRQTQITDFVRQTGRISVGTLAAQFDASPETIRRDLGVLSGAGKIHKVHGGAMPPQTFSEGLFRQRMFENVSAKRDIAQKALQMISPGETLFVDTGSTTLIFAEELVKIDDLTVITNSAEIATTIGAANNSIRVFLLGGEYNADNRETCGLMAIDQISNFRANHAVLAVGGIDAEAGVMDFNIDEAQVARAMINQAESTIASRRFPWACSIGLIVWFVKLNPSARSRMRWPVKTLRYFVDRKSIVAIGKQKLI